MTETTTLFVASNDARTLESIAHEIFAALGLEDHEERFSANYPPDEHYFVAYAANAVVEVFDFDDIKEGYPYAISIEAPTYRTGSKQIDARAANVCALVAKTGLRVFLPSGEWHKAEWGGEGTEYAL
jgi:hypothetical protein